MAVTLNASGTQSATVTTEHFLASPNVAGKFVLYVDLVNMVAGDVIELRVYKMVLAGGTQRVAYFAQFAGPQPTEALIAISEAMSNTLTDTNAVRFSLKQTFGTSRNFPWAVINEEDFTDVSAIKTRVELALPAAAADAIGGLPISDAGGLDLDAQAVSLSNIGGLLAALFIWSDMVGATGNDMTHVHLDGLTYGDDEINHYALVIYDDSAAEFHLRFILDWVLSTELATVATLPFAPTTGDTFTLLAMRQDLAVASVAGLTASDVGAIKTKTDALPTDPADQSLIIAATDALLARLSPIATKTGVVVTDGGNSAPSFKTDLTETPTDHFKDAFLRLTSGALINQVKKITAYNGTTKVITVAGGFTATPADGVSFEIIND